MARRARYVKINGEIIGFMIPEIHAQVTLGASGNVLATAIRRRSQNMYETWTILTFGAFQGRYTSFRAAADHLQDVYDEYGKASCYMKEDELLKQFAKEFEYDDCYDLSCEHRDCCECETFQDCFEEYKESLGYVPGIKVDD